MAGCAIRRDPFLSRRVIVTPSKGRSDESMGCPYCPGGEEMTGPADLVIVQRGDSLLKVDEGEGPVAGWLVRVFRAPQPLLTPTPSGTWKPESDLFAGEPGLGHHLILVATPKHGRRLEDLNPEEWVLALWALQDRLRWLYLQAGVSHVSVFSDEPPSATGGGEAGKAEHPLLHLVGLPFTPPAIALEGEAFERGVEAYAQCPMCRLAASESKGPRHLVATQGFVAFCPWSSRSPYEVWIVPRTHQHSLIRLTQRELRDLGLILRIVLLALRKALEGQGYSLVMHSASERRSAAQFHWHIELFTHISPYPGLNHGMGVPVNPVPPEEAAQLLGPLCRELLARQLGV